MKSFSLCPPTFHFHLAQGWPETVAGVFTEVLLKFRRGWMLIFISASQLMPLGFLFGWFFFSILVYEHFRREQKNPLHVGSGERPVDETRECPWRMLMPQLVLYEQRMQLPLLPPVTVTGMPEAMWWAAGWAPWAVLSIATKNPHSTR